MFGENVLWALFPIFAILSISTMPTLYATGISIIFATLLFAILMTIQKQWHEVFNFSAYKDILIMTFIIGILFYTFIFIGLEDTSPGNASIILLMEIFFTMIILGLWKKEKQTVKTVGGGLLMVLGAVLVLFKGTFTVNQGDLIILLGTILPPIGNYYSQRARKKVSANAIMFIRSVISSIFILALAYIVEPEPTWLEFKNSWFNLFITGFLLLGLSKLFWIEALHRLTVTKAVSLTAYAPAFTLVFAYFMLNEVPTIWQILGFIPMVVGISLITEIKRYKQVPKSGK